MVVARLSAVRVRIPLKLIAHPVQLGERMDLLEVVLERMMNEPRGDDRRTGRFHRGQRLECRLGLFHGVQRSIGWQDDIEAGRKLPRPQPLRGSLERYTERTPPLRECDSTPQRTPGSAADSDRHAFL